MKRPASAASKASSQPADGPMSVLGIDPGSYCCGYGVISLRNSGRDYSYIASGRIMISRTAPLEQRLKELFEGLQEVISGFGPQAGVVEKIFVAKGTRQALSLGHARGVALLALAGNGVPVFEYSALQVKKAVTGYGRAEKPQVQQMVKRMLGLSFTPSPDGADALALAICHTQRGNIRTALETQ
ncbi:MAG: crossover junction endodeoxyribonuclease RuvC [Actinomycetota bacterium]|nr:crossover junction endodeoxyribonuclease RuvC [Nitrospiraceae bacterium]MDA8157168.1 crossover junction endodeoxyribonuclease RuvC [Actinomycetota bacterium]